MEKLWFLEREQDGEIFPMDEKTAYATLHPSNWQRRDFKIIGVCAARMWSAGGDTTTEDGAVIDTTSLCGEVYIKVFQEENKKIVNILPEIKQLHVKRDRYLTALENLLFKDMLPEDDERVKRANLFVDNINKEVDKKIKELSTLRGSVHIKALEAQIESCRGVIEYPDKFSSLVQSPNASPDQIRKIKAMMII